MRARNVLTGLLALSLAGLAACDGASTGADGALNSSVGQRPEADPSTRPIIQLMMAAPEVTTYCGMRRIETHWRLPGQTDDLEYIEEACSDGQGNFAIEMVDLVSPETSRYQETVFALTQKNREGFFYEHRDFRIVDPELFFTNYTLTQTGVTDQIAGRTCSEFRVDRRSGVGTSHRVWMDDENGLILRSIEEDAQGNAIYSMEFESLDLTPDLSGIVFHQSLVTEQPFDPRNPPQAILGYEPREPRLLPDGFQLHEAVLVHEASSSVPWAKYVYTDGLDEVFYLYVEDDEAGEDRLQVLTSGPWDIVQGRIRGDRVILMGKVGQSRLFDMVESAFF